MRLLRQNVLRPGIDVGGVDVIDKLGGEGHSGLIDLLKVGGALRVCRRGDMPGLRHGDDFARHALRAFDRQRHVNADALARPLGFRLDGERRAHAAAQVRMAVGLHLRDDLVEPGEILVFGLKRRLVENPRVHVHLGLDQAFQTVVLEIRLAVDVDPVQGAVVAQGLHLLAREALNGAGEAGKGFLLGIRVAVGQLADDAQLEGQPVLEHLGHLRVGETARDDRAGTVKVAMIDQALNVERKGSGQIRKILVHDASPAFLDSGLFGVLFSKVTGGKMPRRDLAHLRNLLTAALAGMGTAGVEHAAGRGIHRAGQIALDAGM